MFPFEADIYADKPLLDYSDRLSVIPSQTLSGLVNDGCGNIPHPLKITKFKYVHSIQLRLKGKSDRIGLTYIGK